ncbi:MAG: S-methyl-5-thioribose-1-phosphate isomerase [Deltaproteobacteria bacterium]|nr:S-methyl-5-thioribose-1-phosphate isomerase [Deltaproteobacteria bacterium]
MNDLTPIRWTGDALEVLDQRELPWRETWIPCASPEEVARTIRDMAVRGAPAIGITAAYGMALALRGPGGPGKLREAAEAAARTLAATRPTAVNLAWAIDRMLRVVVSSLSGGRDAATIRRRAEAEATAIHEEDVAMNKRLGRHGAELLPHECTVLTHCNAGALATGGYGTALGVIRAAVEAGKDVRVLADETRPYLQGARLTAWELARDGIPVSVICDSMAGSILRTGEVQAVIVGADRIAANGDTANKVGTYPLAVLAARHNVPFYVAAPSSTLDRCTARGEDIPIEERSAEEVHVVAGTRMTPPGVPARHPAFDVTPAELISAVVTEDGVFRAPYVFDRRCGER